MLKVWMALLILLSVPLMVVSCGNFNPPKQHAPYGTCPTAPPPGQKLWACTYTAQDKIFSDGGLGLLYQRSDWIYEPDALNGAQVEVRIIEIMASVGTIVQAIKCQEGNTFPTLDDQCIMETLVPAGDDAGTDSCAVNDYTTCPDCASYFCCVQKTMCVTDVQCQCFVNCEATGADLATCEQQPGTDSGGLDTCGPREGITGEYDGCLLSNCLAQCGANGGHTTPGHPRGDHLIGASQ